MIADQIKRLVEIHATLTPPLNSELKPPTTHQEIAQAESALNIQFPRDLRELLLFTAGQDYESGRVSPFIPGFRFADTGWQGRASYGYLIGIEEIVQRTNMKREEHEARAESADEAFALSGPVKYHNRFIDFTASFNSDNLVVDMSPDEGGQLGQVVMMRTQPCHLAVIASSISAFFEELIDGFLGGRFLPYDKECPVWWDGGWQFGS
jgi:cell wall assembly regulator SMI1